MHFGDGKRKVDYVLAYHYRHRTAQHNGSPTNHRPPAVIVSNGNSVTPEEIGKTPPEQPLPGELQNQHQKVQEHNQQKQQKPDHLHSRNGNSSCHPHEVVVVEMSHQDALEEEKKCQREEFEHNLIEAGLELEKDPEVSSNFHNRKIHIAFMYLLSIDDQLFCDTLGFLVPNKHPTSHATHCIPFSGIPYLLRCLEICKFMQSKDCIHTIYVPNGFRCF